MRAIAGKLVSFCEHYPLASTDGKRSAGSAIPKFAAELRKVMEVRYHLVRFLPAS